MEEIELTYLAKYLPENLKNCKSKEIIDIYIPKTIEHPCIRLRKTGDKFELTKKTPITGNDSSHQKEETIILSKEEFDMFKQIEGRKVHKIRYYYNYGNLIAEIDVFQEELLGLVVIDFEFNSLIERDKFEIPNFCLVDVTQEKFIAGGMLCGKSYSNIEINLDKYNYKKLFVL